MKQQATPNSPLWPLPFSPQDWAQTPAAVQASLHTLHEELSQLKDHMETGVIAPFPDLRRSLPTLIAFGHVHLGDGDRFRRQVPLIDSIPHPTEPDHTEIQHDVPA